MNLIRQRRFMGVGIITLIIPTLIIIAATPLGPSSTEIKVKADPYEVRPADPIMITISISLPPGTHIYSPDTPPPYTPTRIMVEKGPIESIEVIYPPSYKKILFGEELKLIEEDQNNNVKILVKGKIPRDTPEGEHLLQFKISYQICSDESCSPPIIDRLLTAKIKVSNSPSRQHLTQDPTKQNLMDTNQIQGSKALQTRPQTNTINIEFLSRNIYLSRENLLLPLAIAFIAGLLINLMPCVLPIIPIKILHILKSKEEGKEPILLGVLFSAGIITFFLIVGIAAVILKAGFSWGLQFKNIYILMGTILLLITVAIGMFGGYEVKVPNFIAAKSVFRRGYISSFAMGFLGGLLSTPCSFGLLGAAIAWGQLQRSPITLLTFLTIGLGMAVPYIILSASPTLVDRLPRPGRWSEILKKAMGFLILGIAGFLVGALPDKILPASIIYFIGFAAGIWLVANITHKKKSLILNSIKPIAILLLLAIGFGIAKDAEKTIYKEDARNENEEINFKTKAKRLTKENLEAAVTMQRPVIVDFYADWCISCKLIERLVYNDKRLKEILKKEAAILLKADLTNKNEYAERKLQEWTSQNGIPATVLLLPDGRKKVFLGKFSADELINYIEEYSENR